MTKPTLESNLNLNNVAPIDLVLYERENLSSSIFPQIFIHLFISMCNQMVTSEIRE